MKGGPGRERPDDPKGPLPAMGASLLLDAGDAAQEIRRRLTDGGLGRRHRERDTRRRQAKRLATRRQEAVVADALEPLGQHVQQESVDERAARQADRPFPTRLGPHPESDHLAIDADDALVRDGDPVRVATQILQHRFRSAEGLLGIDHPVVGIQLLLEALPVGLRDAAARRPPAGTPSLQSGHELAAKDLGERLDREEEALPGWDPGPALG